MRNDRGYVAEALTVMFVLLVLGLVIIPNIIEYKACAEAKKEPPRFEFYGDIGPEGVYAYLVKDTLTKKQFLIVNKHGGTVALDVTPTAEKKE